MNIVGEVKKRTGWAKVGDIKMEGNYRGRICTASSGAETLRFMISFLENGDVRSFVELG